MNEKNPDGQNSLRSTKKQIQNSRSQKNKLQSDPISSHLGRDCKRNIASPKNDSRSLDVFPESGKEPLERRNKIYRIGMDRMESGIILPGMVRAPDTRVRRAGSGTRRDPMAMVLVSIKDGIPRYFTSTEVI